MESRVCRYCEEKHPITFYEKANVIKGKVYYRWRCNNCYRDLKKARKDDIKQWFQEFKKTLRCLKCDDKRWYVLDFHHRDPKEKENCLSNAVRLGWSKEHIMKEVDKCDIYCANCHRELHWKEE